MQTEAFSRERSFKNKKLAVSLWTQRRIQQTKKDIFWSVVEIKSRAKRWCCSCCCTSTRCEKGALPLLWRPQLISTGQIYVTSLCIQFLCNDSNFHSPFLFVGTDCNNRALSILTPSLGVTKVRNFKILDLGAITKFEIVNINDFNKIFKSFGFNKKMWYSATRFSRSYWVLVPCQFNSIPLCSIQHSLKHQPEVISGAAGHLLWIQPIRLIRTEVCDGSDPICDLF